MDFPIYRKYKTIDVYFKINSTSHFIEYKTLGNRLLKTEISAKIYPEFQFIKDMIDCYENRWDCIEKGDFDAFVSKNLY